MFQLRRLKPGHQSTSDHDRQITRTIFLLKNSLVMGSFSNCDVVVQDAGISGRHCRLSPDPDGRWIVEALDSPYIEVNNRPDRRFELRSGDLLLLGHSQWRFELQPLQQHSLTITDKIWLILALVAMAAQVAVMIYLESIT